MNLTLPQPEKARQASQRGSESDRAVIEALLSFRPAACPYPQFRPDNHKVPSSRFAMKPGRNRRRNSRSMKSSVKCA